MNAKIIGGIIGVVAAGTAICAYKVYSDIKDYRERQITIMANGIEIEVDEDVVEEAINKRVDRVVREEVDAACKMAVAQVRANINSQVKTVVETAYSEVETDVRKELERQVGDVDISDVRKEVVRKAKERAAEKFDTDLAAVLETYNRDLENISKIYSSIAEKMDTSKSTEKSINLNI